MKAGSHEIIAVIDTETNYNDEVMSIGIVAADAEDYRPVCSRYFIITPEYLVGGMFSDALSESFSRAHAVLSRMDAMERTGKMLNYYGIQKIFAYNGRFDCSHLPELSGWQWYDILRIAAYRQTNPYIPDHTDCCKTGRIRSGYGVEDIYRMIAGNQRYSEAHDALSDAMDELAIMRALNHPLCVYEPALING